MEAAPTAKPKRGSPPIPPNYVSLRQLQELRLKGKEQENQQREEAARKAEIEAMAAGAQRPETKVSAAVPLAPVRVKEGRDRGPGPQWVAVAHRPVVPLPARREAVPEAVPIGVGRGNKGPADAPRGGGKREGKAKGVAKEKVSAVTSEQPRSADGHKPAEASSHGGKPEVKGDGKGKAKALEDESKEAGSIGGSGESAGASSRRRKNRKGKKGPGGRSAEQSASAKTADASSQQGVKPENAGKPKSLGGSRADASPTSDSSHGKKADATPAPPTSAAAGRGITAGTKSEGPVEGHSRRTALEVKGTAEQKPRVVSRRSWTPRPGDQCKRAGEQQHGRMWVPKEAAAAAACTEL